MADATSIHQAFLDAVNDHDLARIRDLFHADYTYLGADGVLHHGPEAGVAQVQGFVAAFPDLRIELTHVHGGGGSPVLEGIVRGTPQADLGPLPPTGKTIRMALWH